MSVDGEPIRRKSTANLLESGHESGLDSGRNNDRRCSVEELSLRKIQKDEEENRKNVEKIIEEWKKQVKEVRLRDKFQNFPTKIKFFAFEISRVLCLLIRFWFVQ